MRDRPTNDHRRAGATKLNRQLTPNELVHHRDQDKSNNTSSNLDVMSRSDHTREHNRRETRTLGHLRRSLNIANGTGSKLY